MSTVEFMNLKTRVTKNINLRLINQTVYILRSINLIIFLLFDWYEIDFVS